MQLSLRSARRGILFNAARVYKPTPCAPSRQQTRTSKVIDRFFYPARIKGRVYPRLNLAGTHPRKTTQRMTQRRFLPLAP